MIRSWFLLPVVLVVTGLACGPTASPAAAPANPGSPKAGGTLNLRERLDPFDWDITIQKTTPNGDGIALGYNSLLGWKPGPGVGYTEMILQPELAERWQISPDGRVFTFNLRQGVKYNNLPPVNGRELTSADFKFAADYRMRIGEFKAIGPADLDYIYEGLDRIETPDKYSITYHFKEPYVPFVSYAASDWNPALPKEIYDQRGNFKDTIVGTGAYWLDTAASQKGTRWVWKKNPEYFEKDRIFMDEIRWLVIPNDATSVAAFQTKQVDALHAGEDYQEATEIKKQNPQALNFKYLEPRANQMYISQLPSRNSPVRDLRVRQAINFAIDRDEINKTFYGGEGEWGMPGAMHGMFSQDETKQILGRTDVDRAKRLLAEAGFPNGVSLDFILPNDEDSTNVSQLELLQAQLRKAGIDMKLVLMDRADQRNARRLYNFDLDMGFGLGGLHDDGDSLMMARYHSKSRGNYSVVRDPEMDKLLEATRAEPNPEKRREAMRAVSKRAAENHYTIELLYRPKWTFHHPYVQNYQPQFGVRAEYRYAWLNK